ncbi:hypothetical protein GGI17_006494 [Coemansia sp. S146]|nr:hypothetical protein GGI17_006494 [Coemansia sp. S146]
MPGAPDTLDAAEDQGSRVLLMKSKAALYSSQGLLSGMLALYRDRLVWNEVSSRSSNMLTISMDVMFGATLSPPGKFKFKSFEAASVANLKIESSTHFTVYTIMSRENGKRPLCDTWSFKVDDEDECAMWVSLLRCAIRPKLEVDAEAKALVFLNPISGRRKGLKLFDSIVKPIFEIGCTPYTLIVTESASHAAEFIEHEDLGSYSCVVAMGGDGILHDILNGFLRRSDWPKFKSLPLGAIPAGTGNGLAKSLDCLWPEQAAVAVVKAQSRPLDIMSAALASGRTEYCFLSMTWGLIADIDIESERMRWAGPARLDLYGTIRLMSLRYYGGRLHYLPAIDHEPNNGENGAESQHAAESPGLMRNDNGCSVSNLADRTNQGLDEPWGLPAPSFSSPLVRRDSPKLQPTRSSLSPNIQPAVTLHPTLTAGIQLPITQGSLPPRWKTVEGPFAQVIATNVPWLSASFLACQRARISDGTIDLIYSGAVSKWQILPYISSSTRDNFMNTDGVQHAKVRAFILEPTGLRTTNRSAESHRAIQKPDHHPAKSSGNGTRPMSMPIFASMRSKSINKGNERTNISPRAPVPVRVRSHAYTSYHQQTAGRNSSLLVQGFASSPPSVGRPMESLKDVVVRKRELSQPADNAATLNGSVEPTEYLDGPRPPKQAVFSIRSQTEVASMTMNESAAMTPPIGLPGEETLGLPITHTPIPTTAHITEADDTRPTAEFGADADERADASDGCKLVGNHGIIDLDGEVVELGPIKIECLANLINIICPPWLNESQSARVGTMPVVKVPESIAGSLSRGGSVLSFNV